MDRDFKKYMSAYKAGHKILTGLMAVLCAVFVVSMLMGNDVQFSGLAVFVGILLLSVIPLYRSRRFFSQLEKECVVEAAAADFARALPAREDRIRFGEKWIFTKGSATLVRYEEITQVYQYVHKTNFIENQRLLKYVDTKGKHKTLCSLRLRGKSDEEAKQMMIMIYRKNPTIKIGYR